MMLSTIGVVDIDALCIVIDMNSVNAELSLFKFKSMQLASVVKL